MAETEDQILARCRETCDAIEKYGERGAARALGISRGALRSRKHAMETRGFLPHARLVTDRRSELRTADGTLKQYWDKRRRDRMDAEDAIHMPDPKVITSISTNYDSEGRVAQQWVTEKPKEAEREKLWQALAEEMARPTPRVTPSEVPAHVNADLCTCYPVGDHHMGMYAWAAETGANYDIAIAERLLADAMNHLVSAAPPSHTAIVAVLGDFLHYDSTEAVTPAHRNLLDSDGRAQKMAASAVHALRHLVAAALGRHERVHVIVENGNHDPHSTVFLRLLLSVQYENEPRVTVDMSPSHYHYFEWGANLVGTHHGHGAKLDQLEGIMAADRPEAWGRTRHRVWWTGHVHHQQLKDYRGCTVESFRILPPIDAYAAGKGYRSKRGMQSIILHREHGEVARHIVCPRMFEVS